MADDIDEVERPSFDPDPEEFRKIGYTLIDKMVENYQSLSESRVAKRYSIEDFGKIMDQPFPVHGDSFERCIQFFFEEIVTSMTHVDHPRFHAYIPCPSSVAGRFGQILSASTNPFVGTWLGGASMAALELIVLRWIQQALQLDSTMVGVLTSGGSLANLVGLAAAREKFGRSILDHGVIYVSDQCHGSIRKAAKILGFLPTAIREVPTDSQHRFSLDSLTHSIKADRDRGSTPFFVCGNAGATNTGVIDDLAGLAKICRSENLWFHVDAAYGGFAAIVPEVRRSMSGIDQADSITLDPHKWLYCPMGIGCAFVRDRQWLESAFSADGEYLQDLTFEDVNFFQRGPELSRPARAVSVWMVLRSMGIKKLRQQIEADIALAELSAELLATDERFEVEPTHLSIVNFRHRKLTAESEQQRAARDRRLMEATLASGEVMISTTTIKGKSTLRFVVMNPRTTQAEIIRSIDCIKGLAVG